MGMVIGEKAVLTALFSEICGLGGGVAGPTQIPSLEKVQVNGICD